MLLFNCFKSLGWIRWLNIPTFLPSTCVKFILYWIYWWCVFTVLFFYTKEKMWEANKLYENVVLTFSSTQVVYRMVFIWYLYSVVYTYRVYWSRTLRAEACTYRILIGIKLYRPLVYTYSIWMDSIYNIVNIQLICVTPRLP